MDIFKGFPDEESIVNYTLNQAYQDNVTVFASEPGGPQTLPQPLPIPPLVALPLPLQLHLTQLLSLPALC